MRASNLVKNQWWLCKSKLQVSVELAGNHGQLFGGGNLCHTDVAGVHDLMSKHQAVKPRICSILTPKGPRHISGRIVKNYHFLGQQEKNEKKVLSHNSTIQICTRFLWERMENCLEILTT